MNKKDGREFKSQSGWRYALWTGVAVAVMFLVGVATGMIPLGASPGLGSDGDGWNELHQTVDGLADADVVTGESMLAPNGTGIADETEEPSVGGSRTADSTVTPSSSSVSSGDTAVEEGIDGAPSVAESPGAGAAAVDSGTGASALVADGGSDASRAGSTVDLPPLSMSDMVWPVVGEITRPYGWYRYPALGEWTYSPGVAFKAGAGEPLVRAALPGRVSDVVFENGWWRLRLVHADGFQTEYAGLGAVDVASYEMVAAGQPIGRVDGSGAKDVTFSLRQGDESVDPTAWLTGTGAVPVYAEPTVRDVR